jgi:hypothetical protein
MDPIRTALKFSLIPLRTLVQLGERFVEGGDAQPGPRQAEEPQPPQPQTQRRQREKRAATQRRSAAGPQASRAPKDLDDVAIARKVESIIFRDENVPKGKIDVNAADGVLWLRGEAKTPEMIKSLERDAAAIPEVKRVENLLHLPKTPAPTRSDTPAGQRKTRSTTRRPSARKVETGVTNEGRSTKGEDLPVEASREGQGRRPAPLGSNGTST